MNDGFSIFFRSLGAIVMLYVITRLLGKKQISQLTFFEYILGITLGELAGFMSTDIEENYGHGIIAIITWSGLAFLMEILTLKSKFLRKWFEGKGTVLVKDGKVLEDNLRRERFTGDELMESLRTKNVFQLADVEFAILEASGDLSVLLKKENQPLTPKHLGIQVAPEQEPQLVIEDGEVLNEPLATMGLSRGWLNTELEKAGVLLENVFLGQVDSYGQLFLDLYDDQLKLPQAQNKRLLLATLKKCEADLELFALGTQQDIASTMYANCADELNKVLDEVTPLLTR